MPEDEVWDRGDEAGIGSAEGGGRRGAYAALQPIDGDLEGEPPGEGVGQAAAVVAVDGMERAGAGILAGRQEDARPLAGEAAVSIRNDISYYKVAETVRAQPSPTA